jgi:D-alanyl-D-alanine carboxypeptidase
MSSVDRFLATALERAGQEARADGSSTVEAHHLLLAVADGTDRLTARILASAGLDRAAIRAALDREFEQSLAAAGVSVAAGAAPHPGQPRAKTPPLGASVKLALERGFGSVARKKDLRPVHLLVGILQAQVGTVPRALALAGIDRAALAASANQSIVDGG